MRSAIILSTAILVSGFLASCGVTVSDSKPLVFVAPLVGTWSLETETDTELQFTVAGGQPLYVPQFDFSVDEITLGGTVTYEGSVDGRLLEFRDAQSGAVLFSGELVGNTMIVLADGRRFTKPFVPDWLTGQWQDVNSPSRIYRIDSAIVGVAAVGCAHATHPEEDDKEIQGTLRIIYRGDAIDIFEVQTDGALLKVRSAGSFLGASAIRINRIDGFLHLQRRDVAGTCKDLE